MFKRLRRRQVHFVTDYPQTEVVVARRLRAQGDVIGRSGAVVLTNGTNAFVIEPSKHQYIGVQKSKDHSGAFNLMGGESATDDGMVKLASFGSEGGAVNAHSELMKAYAGIGGGFKLGGFAKVVGTVAGLFVVAVLIGSLSGPSVSQAHAGQSQARASAAAPTGGKNFNPNEPTLEQLAAGQYEFKPQLQAPNIEPPALNCAQR
ncbi:hypothetical protein ABIC83_002711 [Roseateles asaccharophilus]|uniref:hypothetical protein n=1 Tax=Roseateles asaccharophilus TaxID=582607 RepID=UPI0038376261